MPTNISHNEEILQGGAALYNGVFLMTNRQVAVGYRTEDGGVRSLSHPLPSFLQRLGPLAGLAIIPLSWWSLYLVARHRQATRREREDLQAMRWGIGVGLPLAFVGAHFDVLDAILLAILLLWLPIFLRPQWRREAWRSIQDWRRYHGAEHQLVHTVLDGEEVGEAAVSDRPVVSPYCGTNLVMLILPLAIAAVWMPGWFDWLALPALLLGMFLQTWAAESQGTSRLARALLAYGALGQRLTVAPSEARHRAAAIAAWEALGLKKSEASKSQETQAPALP